jgi:hypothetical protein
MDDEAIQARQLPLEPGVPLQISTTIAAVAVALAALGQGEGPQIGDLEIMPGVLLVVGLVNIFGSLGAMAAIWDNAGLRVSDDLLAGSADGHPDLMPHNYQALIVTTWGLWFLTVVYLVMLYASAF